MNVEYAGSNEHGRREETQKADSITDESIKGVNTHKKGQIFLRKINTTMAQDNKGTY